MEKEKIIIHQVVIAIITITVSILGIYLVTNTHNVVFKETPLSKTHKRIPSSLDDAQRFPDDEFISKVQPLLAKRCVACHACYEAPCLLHFNSYESIQRGLTKEVNVSMIVDLPQNRLKEAPIFSGPNNSPRWDQPAWAKRNFAPLFRMDKNGELDLDKSLFTMVLQQGKLNTPEFSLHPNGFSKTHICSLDFEKLKGFYQKYPQSGMPYALPKLEESEYEILDLWIKHGAPGPKTSTRNSWNQPSNPRVINSMENFLNGVNPKIKLSARYIYEHSILSHIHFKGTPEDEFYELVRANNLSGPPVEIVTEKGNDLISIPFFYRLKRVHDVIARKTHALWELDDASIAEWKLMFLEPVWDDEDKIEKNLSLLSPSDLKDPMKYFKQIPEKSRFSFMVKNAEMLVGEIIISPSCSGKLATWAIKDHFWVFFLTSNGNEKFLQSKKIRQSFTERIFKNSSKTKTPLAINEFHLDPEMSLSLFRHESNVTVLKGLRGGEPQSYWLMDYQNYEDLYYNLVINYNPYGKVAHQILTWEHFVNNRKVAEKRFIDLFISTDKNCKKCGEWVWDRWENGIVERVASEEMLMNEAVKKIQDQVVFVMHSGFGTDVDTLNYPDHQSTTISQLNIREWERQLLELTHKKNHSMLLNFPDVIYVKFNDEAGKEFLYSIVTNRTYENNNNLAIGLIDQNMLLMAEENTLVLSRGLVGNHPNLIVNLKMDDAFEFIEKLKSIQTPEDWVSFRKQFALRRNSSEFWRVYDEITSWQKEHEPLYSGVIDLNFYQMFE